VSRLIPVAQLSTDESLPIVEVTTDSPCGLRFRPVNKLSLLTGSAVVLILCGGDKRTQAADIKRAIKIVADWKE
jgi:putative component of toxin-antitoxin plasmid stabilization module